MNDTHSFAGKRLLLTGVGREGQVGEAVARMLAERGATVLLVDRSRDQVEARAASLRAAGHAVEAFDCDLTDAAAVAAVATRVGERTGGSLDALVHMAGGFAMSGPVAESDPDAWQRVIARNLTTAYLATRSFLPQLRAAKRSAIVYFASEAVLPGTRVAAMGAYAIGKTGVVALMRAVAQEERGNGVRANAIAPSAIRTAQNLESMGDGVRYVEREEVGETVAYLCSAASSAVTGQVLRLG